MTNSICYVTLYYDIGRNLWENRFQRSFEDYLEHFEPFIDLFNEDKCQEDIMIVFIDKKHEHKLNEKISSSCRIKLFPIDNDFMNTLPMWKTIEKEREIMSSEKFKNILGDRVIYPEHIYPEYTLINHCKIDLISYLINENITDKNYYSWVDFGFFKLSENIPLRLLDVGYFNTETINYMCIDPLDENDNNILYTLRIAPEKIGGFFFFGRKDKLLEYQKLYHETLNWFQNELGIADDDQHLALWCYFKNPQLFTLHVHYKWHKVFKYYQKQS